MRVALAAVLFSEPDLLLLDEPTAGMGPDERWKMMNTVRRLWETQEMTLIFIEHDIEIVFEVAQTINVLKYGAVLASGPPDAIRGNPAYRRRSVASSSATFSNSTPRQSLGRRSNAATRARSSLWRGTRLTSFGAWRAFGRDTWNFEH